MQFILNSKGEPVPEPNMEKWIEWAIQNRESIIVKQEQIGESFVSTVFLWATIHFNEIPGWEDPPPRLWETMVFGGPCDHRRDQCAGSREQAEAMHERMVELVKKQLTTNKGKQQ
jgi:hypothetical protein